MAAPLLPRRLCLAALAAALFAAAAPSPTWAEPAAKPASPVWKAGDRIDVHWGGTWYPASVLEVKDGKFKIHYDGYGSNWDEWVPPSRTRARTGKDAKDAPAAPGQWKVGDKVEAWNVTWYKAAILAVGSGEMAGYYKVHYENFSGASDQWLKAGSIRAVPGSGPAAGAGSPRAGKYLILSYGSIRNPLRLGSFELLTGERYRYCDNGGKQLGEGKYRFDARTHTVEWLDGPFKQNGWMGQFSVEREGKTHNIRLNRVTIGTNSTDS